MSSNLAAVESPLARAKGRGFWGHRPVQAPPAVPWLWHGYLAPGQVTLLTAQWKSGKTTLLTALLAGLKAGGPFAGLSTRATKAVVVSEESKRQWDLRLHKFDLSHVYFICRPFAGLPTMEQWLDLLAEIDQRRRDDGAGFVAFDTIARLVPANESNPKSILTALTPLERLSEAGMSVLLAHHPRKGATLPGQGHRGSGAFAAFADVVIEMTRTPRAAEGDRRRRLLAFSRSDETPYQRVLELNGEGTDYVCLGDFADDDFAMNWQRLRVVLEDATGKRTRRQLLAEWPADFPRPCDSTLWTWLERAVALGQLRRDGSGRRHDSFRYWLPGSEAKWRQTNPLHDVCEQQEQELRRLGLWRESEPGADSSRRERDEAESDDGGIWPPGAPLE